MNDGSGDVTPILAIVTGALGSLVLTALALPSGTAPVSTPAVHPLPVIHFAPLPEMPAIEHLVLPRTWAPPTPDQRTLVEVGALILQQGPPGVDGGTATFTPKAGPPHPYPDRRKRRRRPGG